MQKYKEINGNDYVKNSRTTINETMQSIQSMNSGTAFPTNNLFEGMKCYRTDLKKTYTLTDVENNTWVEDAHATLSDEATHAASATKLQTARSLNLGGAVTADAATFDGTADATINVKALDASKLKGTAPVSTTGNAATASKLATPRTLSLTGKAAGSTSFDGSANATINVTNVNADTATNADTVDGVHADSFFYNKGDWTDDNWGTMGVYQTGEKVDIPNVYGWGQIISTSTNNTRFQLHASDFSTIGNGHLHYRTGWDARKNDWIAILDSENYNLFAPTKTGTGASGTWDISITGNADTASKLATARNIALTGNATGSATFDGSGNISISTNVNTATNADKLDGYHASDLLKKIAAANTVGIVAASLTENGYVKFANGLILQWGDASGDEDPGIENTTTFPIAFPSTCFTVVLTPWGRLASSVVFNKSKTSFTWSVRGGRALWVAIGN
jgi:hypothetical protein